MKIYFEGKLEGIAKPADPYHNCFVKRDDDSKQIRSVTPPLKVEKSAINYVELVQQSYYRKQPARERPAGEQPTIGQPARQDSRGEDTGRV